MRSAIAVTATLALLFAAVAAAPPAAETLRPIIGILSIPNYFDDFKGNGDSYFAASYVKWLEQGGARVVPIVYTNSLDDIKSQLANLNGVLFTGGGADFFNSDGTLSSFGAVGKTIVDGVISMNKAGTYMPLWATCLGFQMLNVMAADANGTVLSSGFDSENYTIPLTYTAEGKASRMMTAAGSDLVNILATQPVTMNNHHSGVTPAAFYTNPILPSLFRVVSTNVDRQGREFVSTIEGIDLPIYSTQWHPEKVQYEWRVDEVMNHSYDSVQANSFFARFFVNECRGNANHYPSADDETKALIYNYPAIYTGKDPTVTSFQQCYFFSSA